MVVRPRDEGLDFWHKRIKKENEIMEAEVQSIVLLDSASGSGTSHSKKSLPNFETADHNL